jgi:hypothetical protein
LLGERIGLDHIRIAEDFKLLVTMLAQQRQDIQSHHMPAKTGRDISDPQTSLRIANILMGRNSRGQWLGMEAMPIGLLALDRGSIGIRMEMKEIDQIAVGFVIRPNGDGAPGVVDCLVKARLILQATAKLLWASAYSEFNSKALS